MASYPPPYPPGTPFGPPSGLDPRQYARFMRDQAKAQRRAGKDARRAYSAQQAAYRQQNRALRRSSILGPVIILSVGIVALLIRSGRLPSATFANWYIHWWPLLLVAAGLVLVAEWGIDQMPRADGSPTPGRRGVGSGALLLILVLAITGAAVQTSEHSRDFFANGFSINPDNFDQIFGERHDLTQQLDAVVPPDGSVVITSPHGDVTIVGKSDDNRVHIVADKQIFSRSDDDANEKAQRASPQVTVSGSILNIVVPSVDGASSNLNITVPDRGQTTVNVNHGDINVSAMNAPVNVTANHGDIELRDIAGSVNANMNHRNSSFGAHNITGDVSVRGHAQDVNVTDVSGQVTLNGEFFGDTHLQHLGGPMSFRTNRTQFSLARLDGEIDMSPNSELTGNQIVGPTRLRTSSRNISFERVAGDIDVTNSKGSVDLTSSAPLGNINIQNRDGAVNLTVPERASFTVDAETRGGEVENSLGLPTSKDNDNASLRGRVGDGTAQVMIRTNHFDIDIRKGAVEPPAQPTPPAPPARPTKPLQPTSLRKSAGPISCDQIPILHSTDGVITL